MGGRGAQRVSARWRSVRVGCLTAAALLALHGEPVEAQEGGFVTVAPVLSRRLDRDGGPDLGRMGVEGRWFRSGSARTTWGFAAGYYDLGRFPDPVPGDYFDESAWAVGPRVRRLLGDGGRSWVAVGADLLRVTNEDPLTSGSDPGAGGFVGLGVALTPTTSPLTFILEVGVHVLGVTGELTDGSGSFGTVMLGVAF